MNKKILKLALPNILSHITVPLLGIIDMSLMGHLDEQEYLGAVSLGNQAITFLFWNFAFLRMSTAGITAQNYGAKKHSDISTSLFRALILAFICSIALIALRKPLSWLIFENIIGGSPAVESLAKEYFFIRILAGPAAIGKFVFYGWFIGMQNSVFPMIIEVVVNIINISLNFLFVYTFNLTSNGVAYATVIAQYVGFILCVVFFLIRYKKYLSFINRKAIFAIAELKSFFKVNRHIFFRTFFVILVLTYFVIDAASKGTTILNVNTILREFLFIFSFFLDGFAIAGEALVGKYIGSKNNKLLHKCIRYLFFYGIGFALIFTLIYAFAGDFIVSLFTNKIVEQELAGKYIIWVIILPLLSFMTFIWDGVFIGATATKQMMNAILISAVLVFLPVYLLLNKVLGNHAIFLAFVLFFTSRSIIQTIQARKLNLMPKKVTE